MTRLTRALAGLLIAQIVACAAVLGIDDPTDKTTADAGAPKPTTTHLEVGETTVRDRDTRLTWQRHAPSDRYTWKEAAAYCVGLTLDGGGWRLPSRDELLPLVGSSAFAEPSPDWFWSATRSAHDGNGAWVVGVASYANVNDRDSLGRLRCVR